MILLIISIIGFCLLNSSASDSNIKLNSKAFEIAKDLKACLNYEDKIDKIQNAKVGV